MSQSIVENIHYTWNQSIVLHSLNIQALYPGKTPFWTALMIDTQLDTPCCPDWLDVTAPHLLFFCLPFTEPGVPQRTVFLL